MGVEKVEKAAWRTVRNQCQSKTAISILELPHLAKESSYRRSTEMQKTSVASGFGRDEVVDSAKHLTEPGI